MFHDSCQAMPTSAETARETIMLVRKRISATPATIAMVAETQSKLPKSSTGSANGAQYTSLTLPNTTCSPNYTERFAMIPKTVVVKADKELASQRTLRTVST